MRAARGCCEIARLESPLDSPIGIYVIEDRDDFELYRIQFEPEQHQSDSCKTLQCRNGGRALRLDKMNQGVVGIEKGTQDSTTRRHHTGLYRGIRPDAEESSGDRLTSPDTAGNVRYLSP